MTLQALEDVLSVEAAFSDLHRRYEKTKGVLDGFKLVSLCLMKINCCNNGNVIIIIMVVIMVAAVDPLLHAI